MTSIDVLFGKRFDYLIPSQNSDNTWVLVEETTLQNSDFQNSTLTQLQVQLNEIKSSLNDFDITEWSKHTCLTNPASYINNEIRKVFHPELCTQAWCKFHELLAFGDVIPEHALATRKLNAVHLCEAPGAFICSLNHFLRSHHHKVKYKWIGNTLNPYYEGNDPNSCIADDRLIFQSMNNWCFGSDNTGDIFSKTTFDELKKRCHDLDIIHLVTADGSFNCQEKPENQETDTAILKYTELCYALTLLSPGGSFVLKTFTMFEYSSIVLMYILCCTFSSVSVQKPATSKPGNSELYVVARNFHEKEKCSAILTSITEKLFSDSKQNLDIFSALNIPSEFITQHENCVTKFVNIQMKTIKQNKDLFREEWFNDSIEEHKRLVCETAFQLLCLKKIQINQCILKSGMLRGNTVSHVKLRPKLLGSYSERNHKKGNASPTSVKERHGKENTGSLCWRKSEPSTFENLDFVFGKTLTTILLSPFCNTGLLIKLHKNWKRTENVIQRTDTISSSINLLTYNAIASLASGLCGEIFEIDSGDSSNISWEQLFTEQRDEACVPRITKINLFVQSESNFNNSILLASLLMKNCSGGFRELECKRKLLNVIAFMLKYLSTNASFGLLLPSSVSRFTAGMIWILCQCFEQYAFVAGNFLTVPGVFLLFKERKENKSWTGVVEKALQATEELDEKTVLLEIIPLQIILQDNTFLHLLRTCNHQVVDLRLMQSHGDYIL